MWFQAETSCRLSRGHKTENCLWRFYVHCHFYAGDAASVMGWWWIILLFIVRPPQRRAGGLPRQLTAIIFRRENSVTVTNKASLPLLSWHKMNNCSSRSLGAGKGASIISVESVRVKCCTPLRQCVPTLPKRLGRSNGYSGKRRVLMFKSPCKEWLCGRGRALPGG